MVIYLNPSWFGMDLSDNLFVSCVIFYDNYLACRIGLVIVPPILGIAPDVIQMESPCLHRILSFTMVDTMPTLPATEGIAGRAIISLVLYQSSLNTPPPRQNTQKGPKFHRIKVPEFPTKPNQKI